MSARAGLLRGGVRADRTGAARFVDDERGDRTGRGGPDHPRTRRRALPEPTGSADIGLWVFIGVATSLFWLFLLAFALRMNGNDWVTIALPRFRPALSAMRCSLCSSSGGSHFVSFQLASKSRHVPFETPKS